VSEGAGDDNGEVYSKSPRQVWCGLGLRGRPDANEMSGAGEQRM
jgi:hypothetical protein